MTSQDQGERPFDVLLFDLGGVIIEFSGPAELVDLLEDDLTEEEIKRRWGGDPCVIEHESGRTSPEEFAACFLASWPLPMGPQAFLELYTTWTKRFLPGARELLDELRPHYRLACLSNSNPLHWKRNMEVHHLDEVFELCLASHELKALKPGPEIFQKAVDRLGVPRERVAFFDDSPGNVTGAADFGLSAHHVEGVEALRTTLAAIGVL